MLNFSPSSHQLCLCFFACPTQNRWLRSFDPSHSLFSSLFLEFPNMPTSKQTCGSFSSQQPFKVITHHPLGFLPTFLHSSSLGISLAVPLVPLKWCFPPNESILYRACVVVLLWTVFYLFYRPSDVGDFLCFFKVYLDMLQKSQFLCVQKKSHLCREFFLLWFTMALLFSQVPKQDI